MKLPDIYNKSALACLYYRVLGLELTKEQARKKFDQDKKIDLKVLRTIIKQNQI